jgi:hypothetical protein
MLANFYQQDYYFNGLPNPAFKMDSSPTTITTYIAPTYIRDGNFTSNGSTQSFTCSLGGLTIQSGDLLVAQFSGGTAAATWNVAAPWQIIASIATPSNARPFLVAYTLAGDTVTAPTFTTSNAAASVQGLVSQFRNARISAPIGNISTNSGDTTDPLPVSAITATTNNSLAFVTSICQIGFTWPPSGFTQAQTSHFQSAWKNLTNQGDSTGALSLTQGSSGFSSTVVMFEILGNPYVN